MDTYRGLFGERGDADSDWPEIEFAEDESPSEPPPSPVGVDERRMQVRAYNHWASLLDNRNFPSIEDLEPGALPDFGPCSVLLDFSAGIDNPSIRYLGRKLAEECGASDEIGTLDDVPSRSLLSRITDHYMQIIANQAPIGFEAEFVNQREQTILYRGILLPFSSDDDTIDFIYGVINWKELADQKTTDELLLEIDQALEGGPSGDLRRGEQMTDWADGPADINAAPIEIELGEPGAEALDADVLDLADLGPAIEIDGESAPLGSNYHPGLTMTPARAIESSNFDSDQFAPAAMFDGPDADAMDLADWLASARELAEVALGSEDRTRHALYAAIGRAYDFSLAAADAPDAFAELVTDSGLTVQDRAPMTPVVKLVFGATYDKTRLAEYATALSHAHRVGLHRGRLAAYLAETPGGLKGVVGEERRLKHEAAGEPAALRDTPREALARKLRRLDHFALDMIAEDGPEFTLLVARRLPSGGVVLLGEVADDIQMLERAARKLLI